MTAGSGRHRLRVAAPAVRQLDLLTEAVAAAMVEFMAGALLDDPRRLGRPLRNELAGLYAARRGVYRLVYEVDDEAATVVVLRIDHRSSAYRRR